MLGAFLVIGGLLAGNYYTDGKLFAAFTDGGDVDSGSTGGLGHLSDISVGAINFLDGSSPDVNAEIYSKNYVLGETQVNTQPKLIADGAAPNTIKDGRLMIGNDNGQSTTDRGNEYYYRQIDFSYIDEATAYITDEDKAQWIKLYKESTPTWTGYDDGSPETTTNITIGSGETLSDKLSLKIASGDDAALGNPDFNRIGVCVNVSTLADWEEIRPTDYVDTFTPCEAFNGRNMLDTCYVLNSAALTDYESVSFDVLLEAATGVNPDGTDYAAFYFVEETWYKNDNAQWEHGFCDDSAEGTDYDPGVAALTNEKYVWFN